MNRTLALVGTTAWWLLPLLAVAAIVGWETDWGEHLRHAPELPEPIVPKPVVASVFPDFTVEGGLAARGETVGRTLFNPTRRPAPVPVVETPKPTMKRGQFALTGTLVVDGKSTAFLREVAGGKSRRVIEGESINGLLVAEVKADRVRLALGDESESLMLKVLTNPKPTTVAVAPVAAVPAAPAPGAPVAAPPPAVAAVPAAPVASAPGASIADRRREMRERIAAQQAEAAAAAAAPTGATPPPPAESFDPRWAQDGATSMPSPARARRTN